MCEELASTTTAKSGWTEKKVSRRLSWNYSMKIILKKWYYDPK
jgi:hypothetical protein